MKVVFKTSELLPKLAQVTAVVSSKNGMHSLQNVHVIVQKESLVITASDGENWLTERASVIESDGTNTLCIPAVDFLSALRNLGDTTVTMTSDDEKKSITCDYGDGAMVVPYEPADDYPKPFVNMEEAYEVMIDSSKLLKAISLAKLSIANDEIRPIMNGIHFDFFKDAMVCAACDFQKMVKYSDFDVKHEENVQMFVNLPKKPALIAESVLCSVNGLVKMCFTRNTLTISNSQFKMTASLLEGNYPTYNRIIPQNNPFKVEVEKSAILLALKRVLPMGTKSMSVLFHFENDTINVWAEDVTLGRSANENIHCNATDGISITIGFNGSALADVIRNIDDDNIVIELSEPKRAALIYAKDSMSKEQYLSLIMPLDISNSSCSTTNT